MTPKFKKNLPKNWTNNNSESLNHLLKVLIDWKSKPLLELVKKVEHYINAHFKDLKRAIVGLGQYKLAKSHLELLKSVWASKSENERQKIYLKFRNFIKES